MDVRLRLGSYTSLHEIYQALGDIAIAITSRINALLLETIVIQSFMTYEANCMNLMNNGIIDR